MLAASCDVSGGSAGEGRAVQISFHKQHAIPTIQSVDDVRVKIKSCCLDEWDIRMRNIEFPEFLHVPYTPGYAASGVIDAMGPEAAATGMFRVGDEVVVLAPLDSQLGTCAEYTVQPIVNIFPKPRSLSPEIAAAVLWSGIAGMTALHYQIRVRPGDTILLCTGNVCNDLIVSTLVGLFGGKLIVAAHNAEAYELFTDYSSEDALQSTGNSSSGGGGSSTSGDSGGGRSVAESEAASEQEDGDNEDGSDEERASDDEEEHKSNRSSQRRRRSFSPVASTSTSNPTLPPMNPLAHILRVVDCSSEGISKANTGRGTNLKPLTSSSLLLAAVMEETGGLGVDGIIDLQYRHDEWNFLLMKHVTFQKSNTNNTTQFNNANINTTSTTSTPDASSDATSTDQGAEGSNDQSQQQRLGAASDDDVSAEAESSAFDGGLEPIPSSSLAPHSLPPAHPISLPSLISCLAVHGRLCHVTPNLQLDPPLSRQLFLRGASICNLFHQTWIMGATQRGRFAHVVAEVLNLAATGILRPSIHARFSIERVEEAWQTLMGPCHVGKVIVNTPEKSNNKTGKQGQPRRR